MHPDEKPKPVPGRFIRTLNIILFFGLVALFFTACSHPSSRSCQELDWYELGRQDGAKGHKNNNRREIATVCPDSDHSLSEALYHNGFDAGASQYCSPENGFELGRSGRTYADICPPLLQDEFLQSYQRGRRFTEVENQKNQIESRLQTLNSRLQDKTIEIVRRGLLNGEKLELEKKKKSLESEIQALTASNKSLNLSK